MHLKRSLVIAATRLLDLNYVR